MTKPPIHLEIQRRDSTPVGILRSTFRDVDGRIRHEQHGRLTGLALPTLKIIQANYCADFFYYVITKLFVVPPSEFMNEASERQ